MREGPSIGSAAGSASPGAEQAPGLADEPAAIAPDPQPPAAGAAPAAGRPPPPPPAACRGRPSGRPAGLLHRPPRRRRRGSGPAPRARGALDRPGSPGAAARHGGVPRVQLAQRSVAAHTRARKSAKRPATHRRRPCGGAPRDIRGRAARRTGAAGAAPVRGDDVVSGPPADGHSASGDHPPALDRRAPALTCRALAPRPHQRHRPHRRHQLRPPPPGPRWWPARQPGAGRADRTATGAAAARRRDAGTDTAPWPPGTASGRAPPRQRRYASRRRTGRAWRPTWRGPCPAITGRAMSGGRHPGTRAMSTSRHAMGHNGNNESGHDGHGPDGQGRRTMATRDAAAVTSCGRRRDRGCGRGAARAAAR